VIFVTEQAGFIRYRQKDELTKYAGSGGVAAGALGSMRGSGCEWADSVAACPLIEFYQKAGLLLRAAAAGAPGEILEITLTDLKSRRAAQLAA
jgi:hypothetical protein